MKSTRQTHTRGTILGYLCSFWGVCCLEFLLFAYKVPLAYSLMFYHSFSFPLMLRPFNSSHVLSFLLFVILSSLTFFVFLNVHTVNHRLPCPFIVHVRPRSLLFPLSDLLILPIFFNFAVSYFLVFSLFLVLFFACRFSFFSALLCSITHLAVSFNIIVQNVQKHCWLLKRIAENLSMQERIDDLKSISHQSSSNNNCNQIIDLLSVTVERHWWQVLFQLFLSLFRRKGHQREIVEGLPGDLPSPRYLCKKDV